MNATIAFHKIDSIAITPIRGHDPSAQCSAFSSRDLIIKTKGYDGKPITLSIEFYTNGDPENLIIEGQE